MQTSTWRIMEGQRGLYQGGVTESLWEVTQVASCARIDLLAVKSEWAGKRHQLRHQVRCLLIPSRFCQSLDEPKGARHERSLGAFESVLTGWIAVEQGASGAEFISDGVDRASDARRVWRLEVQERQHEQGGVEVRRSVGTCVMYLVLGRSPTWLLRRQWRPDWLATCGAVEQKSRVDRPFGALGRVRASP